MKLALHWKILIGMVLGVVAGLVALKLGTLKEVDGVEIHTGRQFVADWIKPLGTIFINALKVIAVPLIIASLIKGVSDLKDLSRLSSIGGRTVALFLFTTAVAVTLGLTLATIVGPGRGINDQTRDALVAAASNDVAGKIEQANQTKGTGPLQPLVDLVPDNIFAAASNNGDMLQVIVFVLFFGVGLLLVPAETAKPVKDVFDGLNEVILKLIDLIMLAAPIGVFALLAALVAETPSWDVFFALLLYCGCVVVGLGILLFAFYPSLIMAFTGRGYVWFFRGFAPAQMLAFSTSSSAATLPVTMERVEEHLGVDEEVASFVLPIGATVNMDGTSLYQAVAAVFICQAYGVTLSLTQLFAVGVTCILASIGTAAVPSAGIVMLVIVLGQIDAKLVPGIALIFAVDRVLDMLRTVINVTSDATVAMLVAKSVGKLGEPKPKEWDEDYHHHSEESTNNN
jgi:proton glutamate symport protein